MKIAWFTPFCKKSAIGWVSKDVCEELDKSISVDIWTSNNQDVIKTSVPIVFFDYLTLDVTLLFKYDYVVYNMGNFAGYHREIWEVFKKYPGILLLHDQLMHNFFMQYTMIPSYGGDDVNGEMEYIRLMKACYGKRGEDAAKTLYGEGNKRLWETDAISGYPMYEPLLKNATAVFSHAKFFQEEVRKHFYGPIGYAYLPFSKKTIKKNVKLASEFENNNKVLIVSSGIVHPIKRIDSVAKFLLKNPDDANKIQYVVIGDYGGPYGEYLNTLANGPLKGCLYLLGYQPDDVMELFLQKADFCINLRFPNSEICSKSLIEQMAFGKVVIVLNSGIYSEIPDECVIKVNLINEEKELEHAIIDLINDKNERIEMGKRASDFIQENCNSTKYVKRFEEFLKSIPNISAANRVVNEVIALNSNAMNELGFNNEKLPDLIDGVGRQLNKICLAVSANDTKNNILGIWMGFPYMVGLRREGITRFLVYMLLSMLKLYPIKCEIWVYSFNEEEVRIGFEEVLKEKELSKRVKIVTEMSYQEALDVPLYKRNKVWEVNERLDNLCQVAKEYSKADCFITSVVYLDNVIGTGKPIFVPVHDMAIHSHYDDFISKDPLYKARFVDIRSRAENFARADAFMFSNCEFVRHEHLLKYIKNIHETKTTSVYLPVNIPYNININLLGESEIRRLYNLKKPYIFYPTQIRPYKNVAILIEALSLLKQKNISIDLVLTGNPSDVPEVKNAIKKLRLYDNIICLPTVPENVLYSLYKYAEVTAVPTLFEGGFPWQACEALFMDSPLALSNISVVKERIEYHGFTCENSGLTLFDPNKSCDCANAIEKIILNREETIKKQKKYKDKFLSYSWDDAAKKYYNILFSKESWR